MTPSTSTSLQGTIESKERSQVFGTRTVFKIQFVVQKKTETT
jgi:hypothetical protein